MRPLTDVTIKLRPLEREDLRFVHQLNNNDSIMRYWFEEAYESFAELAQLYERNIHNQTERRFIIANDHDERAGMVELVEINHLHRRCEFQIAVHPAFQGRGYARAASLLSSSSTPGMSSSNSAAPGAPEPFAMSSARSSSSASRSVIRRARVSREARAASSSARSPGSVGSCR